VELKDAITLERNVSRAMTKPKIAPIGLRFQGAPPPFSESLFDSHHTVPAIKPSEQEIQALLDQLKEAKALDKINHLLETLPGASQQMLADLEPNPERRMHVTGVKIA